MHHHIRLVFMLLFYFFLHLFVCLFFTHLFMSLCGYVCELIGVRSENNLWELILSFHSVSSGDRTQGVKLGDKHLYPLTISLAPLFSYFLNQVFQVCVCVESIRGLNPEIFDCLIRPFQFCLHSRACHSDLGQKTQHYTVTCSSLRSAFQRPSLKWRQGSWLQKEFQAESIRSGIGVY